MVRRRGQDLEKIVVREDSGRPVHPREHAPQQAGDPKRWRGVGCLHLRIIREHVYKDYSAHGESGQKKKDRPKAFEFHLGFFIPWIRLIARSLAENLYDDKLGIVGEGDWVLERVPTFVRMRIFLYASC